MAVTRKTSVLSVSVWDWVVCFMKHDWDVIEWLCVVIDMPTMEKGMNAEAGLAL